MIENVTLMTNYPPIDYATNNTIQRVDSVLQQVVLYYMPAIVGLGSIGNVLSILVFFTTKLRKLSSSYYLSALAVSDTGFLIFSFLTWLNIFDIDVFNKDGICQISVYFTQVCSFLSVWFIVAFTIERFIAVRYPLKRPSMCTVSRAKAVVIVMSSMAITIQTPYLFVSAPQPMSLKNDTVMVCTLKEDQVAFATTLNHIDYVITLCIPFLTIVILNILISRTVCRVARVRRTMTKTTGTQGRSVSRQRTSSSQTKVTEMLLVVSTVFIILNLPSYALRCYVYLYSTSLSGSHEPEESQTIVLQQYAQLLFMTNFGINFVLYCVTGQNFRRALVTLFCARYRRRGTESTQVTVVSEYTRNTSTRRTVTVNGTWRQAHEMMPINRSN